MANGWKTLAVVTVTTAGTRVQLTASALHATAVVVSGDSLNTGKVYIGDVTVDNTNGHELAPGQSITIEPPSERGWIPDLLLNTLYADTATNGNKVRVQYIGKS